MCGSPVFIPRNQGESSMKNAFDTTKIAVDFFFLFLISGILAKECNDGKETIL